MATFIPREDLLVGRIVNEDEKFILIEIAKSMDEIYTLQEGDRFLTLIFLHQESSGVVKPWKPWEAIE